MTISAEYEVHASDLLARAIELYRDLSLALQDKISVLKSGIGLDAIDKETEDAVKRHQKLLQSVLDIEASVGKRSKACGAGTAVELDLDAARAEIAARLAVWVAAR